MQAYQKIPDSSGHSGEDEGQNPGVEMTRTAGHSEFELGANSSPLKSLRQKGILASVVVVTLLIGMCVLLFPSASVDTMEGVTASDAESFDARGRFIMKDFDVSKPMANFLSGVGGLWGIPTWAFYVNRGQGVASFGIQNKDGGIAEFQTAEKAYQTTPFIGFRTFLKGEREGDKKCWNHMPFFPSRSNQEENTHTRNMLIGMNEMEIEETVPDLGLKTNVLYYSVPNEDFPAFVRKTTFTNLGKGELTLDMLDGLGKLIPSGLTYGGLNTMGRTLEAWMKVYNVGNGDSDITQPFFHITQGTADTATVQMIKDGHFVVSFIEDENELDGDGLYKPLSFIVDPSIVFDTDTSLADPKGFFRADTADMSKYMTQPQGTTARTPCAFAGGKLKIASGKSITITTVIGHSPDLETFVSKIDRKIRSVKFTQQKREEADDIVDGITKLVTTDTNFKIFDDYVRQDYLDNVLRGGIPLRLGDASNPKIFHVFSRIHGDLERDYNDFQIDTTYYSQGPGNFRDVNQNRRLDTLITPYVRDFNIRMFLSFVQADGFNPMTVASTNFRVPLDKIDHLVSELGLIDPDNTGLEKKVKGYLSDSFRPGALFQSFSTSGAKFSISNEEILTKVISASDQEFAALFAQNGFWTDHWTYTLDMVYSFLDVYPEEEEEMMWDSAPVPFYMSPAFILPRKERYTLVDDGSNTGKSTIRVALAVSIAGISAGYPKERDEAFKDIWNDPDYIGDSTGAGGLWQKKNDGNAMKISVIAKFAFLGMIKFAALDPNGMGVEMEGGKPGWNDAMNGLPGLLGSGMPETYETLRILQYVHKAVAKYQRGISLPIEFMKLIESLEKALDDYESSQKDELADFKYWDATNDARETYREDILITFTGEIEELDWAQTISLLTKMENKLNAGINKAIGPLKDISPTYFWYDCTKYKEFPQDGRAVDADGNPPPVQVKAEKFETHTLPLFLEGPTRHLKIIDDIDERRTVYQKVKASTLYDEALKMFTVSESLSAIGPEVGRMVAFSPGWLENQSVWLHMSYKFYLELIRGGLYDEFFTELETGLVPFMDKEVYGRSPLEAASFIVSSAFPDKKLHGASFLARLSGSTAEFLSIWAIMLFGERPFTVGSDGHTLNLKFNPVLPHWMFKTDDTASGTFLGTVKVTYHNPKKTDTWKMEAKKIIIVNNDDSKSEIFGSVIVSEDAVNVRDGKVKEIKVYY